MSTTEFNYAETFRKILEKRNICLSVKYTADGDAVFETGMISVGKLLTSFNIFIGKDGIMQMCFFPAGAVPKGYSADLKKTIAGSLLPVQGLKLFIDKNGYLTAAFETILPADEELIRTELDHIMGLVSLAYHRVLPAVMIEYWQAVKSSAENV